ncbi:MAG: hypothetical protein HRF46_12185, partial [Acidobacteriota bacterium]
DVAPPLDETVPTGFAAAFGFLWQGPHPVQFDVVPGFIEPRRVVVVRGRVLDRQGGPKEGVKVTVPGQAAAGYTATRADGWFDLAVNGGGHIRVLFEKGGFLPVERHLATAWNQVYVLEPVVLTPLDPVASEVTFGAAAVQVATGSPSHDDDGQRTARLLVLPGTTAELILPDGTRQPLSSAHLRLTEYTVGQEGPAAMPAPLPPNVAYTYCLDVRLDEATGARSVQFSRPLPLYLENFLEFPVGTGLPLGNFVPSTGTWRPYDNGVVLKIVGVDGGLAAVDLTGDGLPEGPGVLAQWGFTPDELAKLAELDGVAAELWRVLLPRTGGGEAAYRAATAAGPGGALATAPQNEQPPDTGWPWDINLQKYFPEQAGAGGRMAAQHDDRCPGEHCARASSVGTGRQAFATHVDVHGAPFQLVYRSDGQPGAAAERTAAVQLTEASPPPPLEGVILDVGILGRWWRQRYPAAPNQLVEVTWDGRDAYGRRWVGPAMMTVRVGYAYRPVYQSTPRFGSNGNGTRITWMPTRDELVLWREFEVPLTQGIDAAHGLGGWRASVHHTLNPERGVLWGGDGRRWDVRSALDFVLQTIAGNGQVGWAVDGAVATESPMGAPQDVAFGPDGSLYVGTCPPVLNGTGELLRITPDGIMRVLGPRTWGGCVSGLDVGADGTVYFTTVGYWWTTAGNTAWKYPPGGPAQLIAGGGNANCPPDRGDGGPSQHSCLSVPWDAVVAPDGSIYISEEGTNQTRGGLVRRIDPGGIISTFAGGGQRGWNDRNISCDDTVEGYPATTVCLTIGNGGGGLALAPDGSLWIASRPASLLRRVDTQGVIWRASKPFAWVEYCGENLPAREVCVSTPMHGTFGPDGSYYVGVRSTARRVIWRIGQDGRASYVAGQVAEDEGSACWTPDGQRPRESRLCPISGVAVDGRGRLAFSYPNQARIRRIGIPLAMASGELGYLFPSPDGEEVYLFDPTGRHLWTRDALTGALRFSFAYDSQGRLVSITDGNGLTTSIARAGNTVTITAPHGEETILTLNGDGYATAITAPGGVTHGFTYGQDGLLLAKTDPRGHSAQIAYDARGRVVAVVDAAGGVMQVSRAVVGDTQEVTFTEPSGRTTTYRQKVETSGKVTTTVLDGGCGCSEGETVQHPDGSTVSTARDGTVTTTTTRPDPRLGVVAPVLGESRTRLPSGLTRRVQASRTVELAEPGNPF